MVSAPPESWVGGSCITKGRESLILALAHWTKPEPELCEDK
jgi:hypothetical protein